MTTNIEYVKNGGDIFSTIDEIKEMVHKAKQGTTYKIEMRQKVNKNKEHVNGGESKKNKQSKDGKRNGKQQTNNKPNPCWIDGHNHDWRDCPKSPQNRNIDDNKDSSDKWSKVKVDKGKRKNEDNK